MLLLICILALRAPSESKEVERHHQLPKRLGPAEVAAVLKAEVTAVAFLATTVDLARRGHLSIRRVRSPHGVFGLTSDDSELTHAPHGDDLRDYEVVVLVALLGGEGRRYLSDCRRSIGRMFREFKLHVYRTLRSRGRTFYADPEKLEQRIRRMVYGCGFIGVVGLIAGQKSFGLPWLATALLVRFGLPLIPLRTARGLQVRAEVEAFRVYATSATKAQLTDHGAWNVGVFESLLPYAIAVGKADAWVGRYDEPFQSMKPDWLPDADEPPDELGEFLTMWRATILGLPVRDGGRMVIYDGRYSEGPFG